MPVSMIAPHTSIKLHICCTNLSILIVKVTSQPLNLHRKKEKLLWFVKSQYKKPNSKNYLYNNYFYLSKKNRKRKCENHGKLYCHCNTYNHHWNKPPSQEIQNVRTKWKENSMQTTSIYKHKLKNRIL